MKKDRPTLCERCPQFEHPKKYCRSERETAQNTCRREEFIIVEGTFDSTAKNHRRHETSKNVKNIKWK